MVVPSAQPSWPSSVCCQRLPLLLEGNSNVTLTRPQDYVRLSAPSPSSWPLLTHNSHSGPPPGLKQACCFLCLECWLQDSSHLFNVALPNPLKLDPLSQPPWTSPVAQMVKNLPAMQETWVRSVGWEDPLEKEIATRSSILAWRISRTEEPGGLQPLGSRRGGHD